MPTLFDSLEPPVAREQVQMRPYQQEAVDAVLSGFEEYRKQILVAPTGSGKTLCFSWIAQKFLPEKVLILAHRDELIQQARDKVLSSTGIDVEIEKADQYADLDAPFVVGSVQSMMREKRLERWPANHFGLIIVDECHHILANSYQRILNRFDSTAKILGCTATADRGDARNLGEYFENIAYEISMADLIKQKYLCPITIKTLPIQIDISSVHTVNGDYDVNELAETLDPYLLRVVQALKEHGSFRKTLVFLPLIRTSQRFVELCQEQGLCAEHIDGKSEDREEILKRFKENKIDILVNSSLLLEGYDEPQIDCVLMLRPTKSRPLYCQCIGRGTRIAPGKTDLLLLDFLWLHERHNLIRPAHLIASDESMAQTMTTLSEKLSGGGEPEEHDLLELESGAKQQREDKLREELSKQSKRKSKTMDAIEYCLSVHELPAADFAPTMKWHSMPCTEKQSEFLAKMGINPETVSGRGQASAIIDSIIKRKNLDLATPKQVEWLRKLGHQTPDQVTFKEATSFLDQKFQKKRSKQPLSEVRQ